MCVVCVVRGDRGEREKCVFVCICALDKGGTKSSQSRVVRCQS